MGFCVCSMFSCALLCVLSSFAIILIGMRELLFRGSSTPCHGLSAVFDCGILWSYSLALMCLKARKALMTMHVYAGLSEPLLLENAMFTKYLTNLLIL